MINYVGIPFRTLDCYGLVRFYYKNELGIELPDTKIKHDQPKRIMINFLDEIGKHWKEIKTAKQHCVVAMAMHENHPKLITHFGVMIDEKRILQTLQKKDSHIVSIEDIQVKPFIRGFYTWQP